MKFLLSNPKNNNKRGPKVERNDYLDLDKSNLNSLRIIILRCEEFKTNANNDVVVV